MRDSQNSSNSPNKRLRTSYLSYSQSVKDGEVPEQYTPAYEKWIFLKGLDMNLLRGRERVSEESKKTCTDLSEITREAIQPTLFPREAIPKALNFCYSRNAAIVNRDVTPMIVPPVTSLYLGAGDNSHLEHVVDEVGTDWHKNCILEGPQPRPDLALGLFPSAFTSAEVDKLNSYTTVDNWTKFTEDMYFPFLMCEVKCSEEGLGGADCQNMHSCSVAVRALLRIEQEADRYRAEDKKGLSLLNGQIVAFSISHDQQDARLYGHYALIQEKWSYRRYLIRKYDLITENGLLALFNFVQNVLKLYVPKHLKRLKDALAALPDPTNLSFSTSEMALQDSLHQSSQDQNAGSSQEVGPFKKPPSSIAGGPIADELRSMTQQQRKDAEQQRKDLMSQLEQDRKDAEQQRKHAEQHNDMLMARLEQQQKDFMALIKQNRT